MYDYLEGIYGLNLCAFHSWTGKYWFKYNPETNISTVLTINSSGCITLEKDYAYD